MRSESSGDAAASGAPKCDSCSATLKISPASWHRGMEICEDCAGLCLLHEAGTDQPLLRPTRASGETYEIADSSEGFEIRVRSAPESPPCLTIHDGSLEIHRPCSDPLVMAGSDLSRLRVKHDGPLHALPEERGGEDAPKLLGSILTGASAGVRPPQEPPGEDASRLARFRIVANLPRGSEICLLEGIDEVREAFSIAEALKRALS
jgi:hypothetical protein